MSFFTVNMGKNKILDQSPTLREIKNTSRFFILLILSCCAVFLAGCSEKASHLVEKITTPRVNMPSQCSGWEKLTLKNRSRYYLMEHDQRLLVNIEAHNARGQTIGCWQ